MQFEDLRGFVESLEKIHQLKRITTRVSVDLEIAEILRRVMYKNEGPAVLFENVEGYKIPVLGNAFGSLRRLKIALDMENFEEIGERMSALTRLKIPHGLLNKFKMLPKLSEIADYGPKSVNSGPITEIIETTNPSLNILPIIKSFPKDSGRFITFGITVTKNPETQVRNMGVYRLQVIDSKKAIMHWQIHKRGALHYQMNKENSQKTEVAIVIGADPATVFSAVAPVPEGLDKFLFAGITRKKGIDLVKCRTIDVEVPATAEIVLEGYVDPSELNVEGPFGDHTGYYTPPEPFPTFTLTGIMMRKNPIYLTTVVGKPILEDAYIGKVIERSFLPLVRLFQPEVVDFSMPPAGWFQGLAIVSIKKRYPGQAKKVMMGLWGMGQLSLTKILIVVDQDVNVHDMNDVIWAVTTRADPKRDTMLIDNAPTDTLDPASSLLNLGSKMGIDATKKMKEEGYERPIQEEAVPNESTVSLVTKKWNEYGFQE
ncbi:MAG: menaquinone biosynthesis decarboxylase [Nitrososphaeraceae archaeon]|nr:menaquinone biosynthesis decarboxylase [Nitrososphaeraceae archaeon]MDW0201596.1 menaquinone biosynthesis decarboxylase [Nitrososphaeraceae archaeon]MDW0203922.1 menaquinone biosynthesis decarboxylase [Nitrososphaeraceae archaeon]MDW0234061.1 menaquinone biosynthesis decarboxylase [Nitrososphaeraceae archaeon]MDW0300424.1 menaquinone biosynthesis decarboxylase [Nitrososphaeraceae archaeon]